MADKIPLKLTTGPNEIQEFAGGDTVGKGNLPNDTVYVSSTQTLNNKTLGVSTGCTFLRNGAADGPITLAFAGSTSSGGTADHVKVTNSVGSGATISADHTLNANVDLKLQAKGTGKVYVSALGPVVGETGSQTLTNKTLTTPTIASFTNATHTHQDAAGGGLLSTAAIGSGSWSQDRLGDTASRSGSYAFGRGSAVLVDSGTAAGSNGTAVWAQRPRVLQVLPGGPIIAGTSATPVSTLQTVSAYNVTLSASSGVSVNVTPDCLVDSTGGPVPTITSGALNGKLFRVTVNGQFQTAAASARTITISSRFINSATVTALVSWPTSSVLLANFHVSFLFSCLGQQNQVAFVIPIVEKQYAVNGATQALIAPQAVGTNTFANMALGNNSALTLDVQAQMTGAAASIADKITILTVFYEALN
jgi:hypothetical protein